MAYQLGDTIAAVATAPGGAGRGIVRISGPEALQVSQRVLDPPVAGVCDPGSFGSRPRVIAGEITLSGLASSIPATVYVWPTARSFTGEPTVELHVIGSPPLVGAVLSAACAAGARSAAPGEFTLRAFLSGRIDLTEAEAVLGVIDARSDDELRAALGQLAGGVAGPLREIRRELLELLADLEAGLDFAEEDIEFISRGQLNERLAHVAVRVAELVGQLEGRRHSDEAPRAVLVGWPNVGKSQLLNALAERPAALVSDQSGTTRDYLTTRVDCGALAVEMVDTAGVELAEALDPQQAADAAIRGAAQALAGRERAAADVELFCLDSSRPLNNWEHGRLAAADGRRLVILTKCDLARRCEFEGEAVATSSATGAGLEELRRAIAAWAVAGRGSAVAATAARCGESVRLAGEAIQRARALAGGTGGEELIAAEVRVALAEIAKMAGTVYTDDLLDQIFSRFCIGK